MIASEAKWQDLRVGSRARVTGFRKIGKLSKRLMEMGLTVGAEFTVQKVAPLGDPIEIVLRGYRLCLRKRESDDVRIEILP